MLSRTDKRKDRTSTPPPSSDLKTSLYIHRFCSWDLGRSDPYTTLLAADNGYGNYKKMHSLMKRWNRFLETDSDRHSETHLLFIRRTA
jgi:hypothetical protein